jgi:hypothetical protein
MLYIMYPNNWYSCIQQTALRSEREILKDSEPASKLEDEFTASPHLPPEVNDTCLFNDSGSNSQT